MSWTPPGFDAADFDLAAFGVYSPPLSNAGDIDLAATPLGYQVIAAAGIASTLNFGAAVLTPVVFPQAFAAGSFPSPGIRNEYEVVAPSGIGPGAVGAPVNVYNRTQDVRPVGFYAGDMPLVHRVEHSIRTLEPPSIVQTAFGTHDLAGGVRWIDHAGHGSGPQTFGTTFVAPAVRFMYPVGIHALMWGVPIVDQTHFVDGTGFDAIEWGVLWIHDNKQYAENAGNLHAISWGMAEVTRSPRELAPTGFSLRDVLPNERWGRPDVWNLTQFLRHYHDIEPDEGGVFGSPLHMAIENRNRTVGAVGFIASRIPNSLVIDNTGRPLLPVGWDSAAFGFHHDGLGFIAYRIRSVKPTDEIGPERFSNWNAAIKTPQFFPVGIAPMGQGAPHVERGPEFHPVGFGGETFGTAFVAPRIRTLSQYFAYEGRVAGPDVQLWMRYVAPAGIAPREVGAHTLEHHRNEFRPRWNWQHDLMGTEIVVRNVTPELYQHGAVQTEWGGNEIRWNPYPLRPPGLPAIAWGNNIIEHREKYLGVYGIEATRWGPNSWIRNDQPDPPFTRTYGLTGFSTMVVPNPMVRRNEIEPPGFVAIQWGRPTVEMMGCYPTGWISMVFGVGKVSGPQYVTAGGMKPPDELGMFPAPRMSPFTIYCSPDKPPGYTAPGHWEQIDQQFEEGSITSARPFFGKAFVSNQYRTLYQVGSSLGAYGLPSVDNQNRVIAPDGLKAGRIGFPVLPHTEEAIVWPIAPTLEVGQATVINQHRILYVGSVVPPMWGGNPWIDFFNREIKTPGWDSFTMSAPKPYDRKDFGPLSNRIHFPEPIIAGGQVLGEWGVNWISHRIRTVEPVGLDSFLSDYTWEDFKERMRVRARGHFYPPSILPLLGFGVAFIDQSIRNVHGAGNIRTGWMGSPEVRFISNVALGGYGWDSSVFGDVDRWDAGKIKPHGDDLALYGNRSKVNRGINVLGWDSATFGDARRGDAFDPAGFDCEEWGVGTITHGDAMEFTCGGLPRGIPPQGFMNAGWGTAEIAHV